MKEATNINACEVKQVIKCGQKVRLEHLKTTKNLHSDIEFKAPLSSRQEVSCFGHLGEGDDDDDWEIQCERKKENLFGKMRFYLKHINSGKYLYQTNEDIYTNENCQRCPIIGQGEISLIDYKAAGALWIIHGVFYHLGHFS